MRSPAGAQFDMFGGMGHQRVYERESPAGAQFDSSGHRPGRVDAVQIGKPCKGVISLGIMPFQGLRDDRYLYPARCAGLLNRAPSGLRCSQPVGLGYRITPLRGFHRLFNHALASNIWVTVGLSAVLSFSLFIESDA